MELLTRDQFRERVQARDQNRCIVCGKTGKLDSHHVVERRLFSDGGYYMDNGVSLCDPDCHMKAESTEISCDTLRELAGIKTIVLPGHLYADDTYDKWGNQILPNGNRLRGELFWDESVRAVIKPYLHLFQKHTKPPRTWRLPWNPDPKGDDRILPDTSYFQKKEVVVTTKMDGENVSIYGPDGYCHARKVEPINTPDSDRVKALAATIGSEIPDEWRVCGESLIRQHTIHYQNLKPHQNWFYQVFNIWDRNNNCLHWDQVVEWAELLDLPVVQVLYRVFIMKI